MVVGHSVPLIGMEPDPRTLGPAPDETCKETADVSRIWMVKGSPTPRRYFYVVGSHGCGRNSGKFRLSSFILARVRVDRLGQPVDGATASGRRKLRASRRNDLSRLRSFAAGRQGSEIFRQEV